MIRKVLLVIQSIHPAMRKSDDSITNNHCYISHIMMAWT